jgi:hypothetical protein
MKSPRLTLVLVAAGLITLAMLGVASALTSTSFGLESTNTACLPEATGRVTVLHREEASGADTLRLDVAGLPANSEFAVFLTQASGFDSPPFGAVSYIGDVATNTSGVGTLKVDMTVAQAFISRREGDPPARVRIDLDHVALWFADPADVPGCFRFTGSTPFDGDGAAGPAVLSSLGTTGLEVFP